MKDINAFLEECPGLVGEIARCYHSHCNFNQPESALGAALCLVSTIFSKRIYMQLEIRETEPSLLICVVAETGIGKTQAQQFIEDLINESDIIKKDALVGYKGIVLGPPASDSALMNAMSENGQRILIWDELGKALQALSKSSSTHESQIATSLMKLSTGTGRLVKGKHYADTEKAKDIKAPYLNVLGGSTPNRFYGALTEEFIHDGFLGRWLLFVSTKQIKKLPSLSEQERINLAEQKKFIVDCINKIWAWYPSTQEGDLVRAGICRPIERKKVHLENPKMNDGVFDSVIGMYISEFDSLIINSSSDGIRRPFYMRAKEQFCKIALCFTEVGENGPYIPKESLEYAFELTNYLIQSALFECESNIFGNEKMKVQSDVRNGVLALIRRKEISASELTAKLKRKGTVEERRAVIKELVESGTIIEYEREETNSNGRTYMTRFYKMP